MTTERTVIYISQGIDYIGFLNAKLRDLRGWGTLLNELVQNADDPEDATRITIDVTDDALIFENDGLFTDCGDIENTRCEFDLVGDGRICCDFHAFRRVASGHKRQEEGTTGAFGIGFISVYQITDQPSLRSGKWLWTLRPEADENRRIKAKPMDMYKGTRFVLPWAKTISALRTRLGLEAVPENVVDRMCNELCDALLLAAPFLKRLQTLELRKRGKTELMVSCTRNHDEGKILIDARGKTQIWKRLDVNFDADAQTFRTKHPGRIEDKRKAKVTVAVPLDGLTGRGRLYATLPTEHEVGLPVLINADFFPSSDRKRILFDHDYQGDWNRAAIRAAARAIAGALLDLRNLLKPVELWKLFEFAEELQRSASESKEDTEFASFWKAIQPELKSGQFVLSSLSTWCAPGEIRLLQNAKEEAPLLPLLESLQQNIVHLDLQSFSTLLRDGDVGVRTLTLDDLSSALTAAELTRPVALDDVPAWLRNADNRRQLGTVIAKLHERVAKDAQAAAAQRVCNCSLVVSTDGRLTPPKQLRIAEIGTRDLLSRLSLPDYWASDSNPVELSCFVAKFSVKDAVSLLQRAGGDAIQKEHEGNKQFASDLIAWFAEHRHFVAQSVDLKNAVCVLPIWPSGTKLYTLNELSVPGGFKDPLSLAKILDPTIAEHWHSFLIDDLHAKELTIETYLIDQVPSVFADEDEPSDEIRQSLMKLLITHSGTLLDNASVARALRLVPIVRCTDGEFRCGKEVYFNTDVVTHVLADSFPIAAVSEDSSQAAQSVFAWLGVRSIPDADDILRVVEESIEEGPTPERRERIQAIFKGLAEYWAQFDGQDGELNELKRIAWLPSNKTSMWHKPGELYSVFLDYLFASQANFLDVPRPTQQKAGGLLEFLGIQTNPQVALVAKHLLTMAEKVSPVNMQVYEFLNRHADNPSINLLRGKKCLFLDDHTYSEPGKAMWGEHRFGRFRKRLSTAWRQYQTLLEGLGVLDEYPTANDAVAVLQEIATDYSDNRKLDDSDYEVMIQCWALMSEHLGAESPDWRNLLADRKVVANANRFLVKPNEVFFDDRPGMVERFGDEIRRLVIRRPDSAWRAMSLAGVDPLSQVVSSELVECVDPVHDTARTSLLAERWPLVRRIFATHNVRPVGDMETPPEILNCQRLTVVYRILDYPAPAEDVFTHLTDDKKTLYLCASRKNIWIVVAKELACAYFPDGNAGILASAIKDVLIAYDLETAREELNELGISDIDFDSGKSAEGIEVGLGAVTFEGEEYSNPEWEKSDNTEASLANVQTGTSDAESVDLSHDDPSGAAPKGTPLPPSVNTGDSGDRKSKAENKDRSGDPHYLKGDGSEMPSSMVNETDGEGEPRLSGNKNHRQRKKQRGRLVSYVFGEGDHVDKPDDGDETNSENKKIGDAAVQWIIQMEAKEGRVVEPQSHENEGFDLLHRLENGDSEYIEVKGSNGPWTESGVSVSPPQIRYAAKHGERFWLYVVEYALDTNRRKLWRIKDPFGQATQFMFDSGWKKLAESVTASNDEPAKGYRIDVPGKGVGEITQVIKKGHFFKLQVKLDSGASVFINPFVPGKMKLIPR